MKMDGQADPLSCFSGPPKPNMILYTIQFLAKAQGLLYKELHSPAFRARSRSHFLGFSSADSGVVKVGHML
jgi:hypothetical protein